MVTIALKHIVTLACEVKVYKAAGFTVTKGKTL